MNTRFTAQHRRHQILSAAQELSFNGGLYKWSLSDIADKIAVSRSAVRWYFTTTELREFIIKDAINEMNTNIVTQAIVARDPLVNHISDRLRKACIKDMDS